MYFKATDPFNEKWHSAWIITAFWDILAFALLCVICYLWAPSQNSQRCVIILETYANNKMLVFLFFYFLLQFIRGKVSWNFGWPKWTHYTACYLETYFAVENLVYGVIEMVHTAQRVKDVTWCGFFEALEGLGWGILDWGFGERTEFRMIFVAVICLWNFFLQSHLAWCTESKGCHMAWVLWSTSGGWDDVF